MDSSVYLTTLTLSSDAEAIEDVQSNVEDLIQHAETLGFTLVDGSTSLSRERDPIEQVVHSAGDVFRNKLGQERIAATAGHATDSREDRSLIAGDPEGDTIKSDKTD